MGKWQNKRPRGNHHHSNKNFDKRKGPFNKRDFTSKQHGAPREPKVFIPFASLKEEQVEITEYVRNGPGFTGTIKERFSDFHVNEIDTARKEVKLTDLEIPKEKDDSLGEEELKSGKKELEEIITEEIWNQIRSLIQSKDNDKKSVDIDVTDLDKDKRTLVHKTLKSEFGSSIVSTTSTVDNKKFIQCFKAKNHQEVKRNKWLWPGEYVYFVVHKENIDTVRAASDLAKNLKLRPSMVNYAGTKDKRAKTSQLFCVKKREPSDIAKAARRLSYLKVGNFTFKDKVLKLGDLKGNRFRIAIRQVDGDPNEIEESLKSIKENGFVNYYGLQRFGNCAGVPTFEVGIALLKSEYKEACELILKPREGEQAFMKNIREFWWETRDSVKAAGMFYDNKFIEKKLLDGLAEYGEKDYANALRKIPRNMLLLYTHAYQSLVWNRVASRRIKDFGLNVIPGDLVFKDKTTEIVPDSLELFDDADIIDDVIEETAEDGIEQSESQFKTMVKSLTEEDISNNTYSIFDVVLPLPGYDITYPGNVVAQWYEEILAEKGLSSEKLKHNVKTYSLAGAYRKLVAKPENLTWEFKGYNDSTCNLIASDWENLKEIKIDAEVADAKFKALILDFTLQPSSYATMALREILKADTSAASQQKLAKDLNEKNQEKSCENEGNEKELTEANNGSILEHTVKKGDQKMAEKICELEPAAGKDDQPIDGESENNRKRKLETDEDEEVKKSKPV